MYNSIKIIAIMGIFCAAAVIGVFLAFVRLGEDGSHMTHTGHEHFDGRRKFKESGIKAKMPRIPAYFSRKPEKSDLRPTLDPLNFSPPARDAYRAVREIPELIAQLPCFCHCDETLRHRSLHSCFENEHGGRCAVCINEALTARRLLTEENLTAEQIRARLIEIYTE